MKKAKTKNTQKPIIGINNYVQHSMSILDRIHELLDEKFEGKQIELAKKLGKKESEISKWLNGVQNFTIFTISKLEEAFEDSIISVPVKENTSYPVPLPGKADNIQLAQKNYYYVTMTPIRGSYVEKVEKAV